MDRESDMGYTTDFDGSFKLDRPLIDAQREYLMKFAETRRMKRDAAKAAKLSDPIRKGIGLPIGVEGEFFVGGSGPFGQGNDASILNYNTPPKTQPGLWCQWVPNEEGTAIEWNGSEKFYEYTAWLVYLIDNFLKPWGHVLNGRVSWQGEDHGDVGLLVVKDNVVTEHKGYKAMAAADVAAGIALDMVRISIEVPKRLLEDLTDEGDEDAAFRVAHMVREKYEQGDDA